MRDLKTKEIAAEKRAAELDEEADNLQKNIILFEAKKSAVDAVLANDYQLSHIEMTLRGYQINILTLSAKLRDTRKKVLLIFC